MDWRRLKTHRSYTIEELAVAIGCHRNTARGWMRQGLTPLEDGRRPLLFHGGTTREFLRSRRARLKRKCLPHELYCFGCKEPRSPAGAMADFTLSLGSAGVLSAICGECTTLMFKRTSAASIEALRAKLDIKITGG